jgi:hypothetical protein
MMSASRSSVSVISVFVRSSWRELHRNAVGAALTKVMLSVEIQRTACPESVFGTSSVRRREVFRASKLTSIFVLIRRARLDCGGESA